MSSRTTSAGRPDHAARREPVARSRRVAQVVLVVGSVLALVTAAGPLWLVRVGVVLAVATCVVTCVLAWRELAAARRLHAHRLLAVDRRHGEALRGERTRNAQVVDALTERLSSTGMVVAGQRSTLAALRGEVGVLTVERDDLRAQVSERDGLIGLFRTSLRDQEAELLAVRARQSAAAEPTEPTEPAEPDGTLGGAEVHALPRRSRPATAGQDGVLDAEMAELAMVLPNYEGSRRVG